MVCLKNERARPGGRVRATALESRSWRAGGQRSDQSGATKAAGIVKRWWIAEGVDGGKADGKATGGDGKGTAQMREARE